MKKFLLSMFLLILILVLSTGTVFASTSVKITEVPHFKIIMNGKLTEYTDVPIIIEGRTMLPLRELLVNLGVPNDDEHIIYNGQERSVTIVKGETRIYLVAGNKTALVNDEIFELDVAPVIYSKNSRTYIPLRFVAEALDMKVVWEEKSKAVLLCDKDKYESNKEVFLKSAEATGKLNYFKEVIDLDVLIKADGVSAGYGFDIESQVDRRNKRIYTKNAFDIFGMQINTESYYSDNTGYTLSPLKAVWEKQTYTQPEFDELFTAKENEASMVTNEVLYTGMTQMDSENSDEILLKGDVYLTQLVLDVLEQQESSLNSDFDMDMNTYNIEISLDSKTFVVNRIIMKMNAEMTTGDATFDCDINASMVYSDQDGDFTVTVPEEAVKSAVDVNEAF